MLLGVACKPEYTTYRWEEWFEVVRVYSVSMDVFAVSSSPRKFRNFTQTLTIESSTARTSKTSPQQDSHTFFVDLFCARNSVEKFEFFPLHIACDVYTDKHKRKRRRRGRERRLSKPAACSRSWRPCVDKTTRFCLARCVRAE